MKLKTRIRIIFISIVILPVCLAVIAFVANGMYFAHTQPNYGIKSSYVSYIIAPEDSTKEALLFLDEVHSLLESNPYILEDKEYLEELSHKIKNHLSYIIVRKGARLYFTNNETGADSLFDKLPAYGRRHDEAYSSYYYEDMGKFVEQLDFVFTDGEEGSLFVITRVNSFFGKRLMIYMFIAIVIILLVTALTLTKWMTRGVFGPINELNIAMQKIADGDFEYHLECDFDGEIGDLCKNYEQMRLRLKESTNENEDREKQHRELISNISHDLKTPITSIKGYVEGIMDGVADTPEKIDKYVRTIYNKANDMDRLINELTLYSNIDNQKIPYHFLCLNVNDYFNDCVEEVGLDLEAEGIRFNYSSYVSPDTRIIADPEQLKKVINNIISNSVKYMDKEDGEIEVRVLDELDSIRVEIEDNGRGIAARDLSKIFDRFYRTDSSRNSSKGGSGIGLSIVKRIVEDHGGYIWATSKEGEGTCMHFVIRKFA